MAWVKIWVYMSDEWKLNQWNSVRFELNQSYSSTEKYLNNYNTFHADIKNRTVT